MKLDLDLLEEIDSEFADYAEENLNRYGLDLDLEDNMTPEECEKVFLDAVHSMFPMGYDYYETFYDHGYMYEYTQDDFRDFLIGNFDIYLDYDRNLGEFLIHDSDEHDEWFKTTDAYKEIQKENAAFQEAAKNSSGHAIVYPGIIFPHCESEYRRLPKLLPEDTKFKYLICTGHSNNTYLMDIGYGNTINPKEFKIKKPEGFIKFTTLGDYIPKDAAVFDSVEHAQKAAEYLSINLSHFDVKDQAVAEAAMDYIRDVMKVFGIETGSCTSLYSPGVNDEKKDHSHVVLQLHGHRDSENSNCPTINAKNWREALNTTLKIYEKFVPFEKGKGIPVYKNSYEYAKKFGEVNMYLDSHWENIACLNMIHKEIENSPDKENVPESSMKKIIDKFGKDRVSWVVSNVSSSFWMNFWNYGPPDDHDYFFRNSVHNWTLSKLDFEGQSHDYRLEAEKHGVEDPYHRVPAAITNDKHKYFHIMENFILDIYPMLQNDAPMHEHENKYADKEPEKGNIHKKVKAFEHSNISKKAAGEQAKVVPEHKQTETIE